MSGCTAANRLKPGRNPYDIHCYWPLESTAARTKALALREKTHSRFPWLIRCPVYEKPRGPHSSPYWEADFGAGNEGKHAEVLAWLRENYDGDDKEGGGLLSILLHPNTTDGVITDHRPPHAIWIGKPVELREYMFYMPYAASVVGVVLVVALACICCSRS